MSQIKTKFVTADNITDTKIKLASAAYLRSRNNAGSADVNIIRTNASDVIEFPSVPQIASGTPSASADITNVSYVGTAITSATANLSVKSPVRAISTSNLTLSAPQTVDGVSLLAGDRVLVAGQTTASGNGIYLVAAGSWTRTSDFNSTAAVYEGVEVPVAEGTVNAQTLWQVNSTGGSAITIGTTSINFTKVSGSTVTLPTWNKESLTLSSGDITNQYKDLAHPIKASSLDFAISGTLQSEGLDYSISLTGGSGGNTRVTFLGDLATGGNAALVSGDVLYFKYTY